MFGGARALALPPVTEAMRKAVGGVDPEKRKVALAARRATRGGNSKVEGVPDTGDFMWRHGDNFDVLGWINGIGWETRSEPKRSGNGLKQIIKCPNESQHSPTSGVDQGCVAIMPNSGYGSAAKVMCQHDHCAFSTGDFLEMFCEEILAVGTELPALENYVFVSEETKGSGANDNRSAAKLDFTGLQKLLEGTPYALKHGWIEYRTKDEKGEPIVYRVCKAFQPLDMTRAEKGGEWSVRIRFADFNGELITAPILVGELLKERSDLRANLANLGLDISLSKAGFNGLFALLKNVKERSIVIKRPGWRPDLKSFVCPDGVVIRETPADTVAGGFVLEGALTEQVEGTLEGQLEAWEIAFTKGSPHHFVAAVAGAAGTLVQYVDWDSSPLLLLSGGSGSGKTSGKMLGAGVHGEPDIEKKGLLHSLRTTANKAENTARCATGITLFFDEAEHFEGDLQKFIFMLASGAGKGRMKGDSEDQDTRTWKNFTVLSAEHGMVWSVEQAGRVANTGLTARCADLDCSGTIQIPDQDYFRMMALIKDNHGHIGPKFVVHLLAEGKRLGYKAIRARIDAKSIALAGKGAASLILRAAGVFAVLWETGELLQAAGLLPSCIVEGEVERRIRDIWTAYHHSDEAKVLTPGSASIDRLRETLYARMNGDVQPLVGEEGVRNYKEALAWFGQKDLTLIFYVRSAKIEELAGGVEKRRALITALKEAGVLIPAGEKTNTWDKLPGGFRLQHYQLAFELEKPKTAASDYAAFTSSGAPRHGGARSI